MAVQSPVARSAARALAAFASSDGEAVRVDLYGLSRNSVLDVVERVREAGVYCYAIYEPDLCVDTDADAAAAADADAAAADFVLYMHRAAPARFADIVPLATRDLCDALVLEDVPDEVYVVERPPSLAFDVLPSVLASYVALALAYMVARALAETLLGRAQVDAGIASVYAVVDALPRAALIYAAGRALFSGYSFLAFVGIGATLGAAQVGAQRASRDMDVRDPVYDAWAGAVLARRAARRA